MHLEIAYDLYDRSNDFLLTQWIYDLNLMI